MAKRERERKKERDSDKKERVRGGERKALQIFFI